MSGPCRRGRDGLLVDIRLQPGASCDAVGGLHLADDGRTSLKARVRAQPEKGQANKALIKLLSKALSVPKSELDVVSGQISRNKTVLVRAADPEAADETQRRITILGRMQEQ